MRFEYPAELRFQCTKCGLCCGDTPEKTRHILLLSVEAEEIAEATQQPISVFAEETSGKAPYQYEMKKNAENGACVFLKNNRCTIYALRPLICRFYPFELATNADGNYQFLPTSECPSIGKGEPLSRVYFEKLFQLAKTKMQHDPENT